MKVFLRWQLDLIKLRLLRLFLCCSPFYSSICYIQLVLIRNIALKLVCHTRIGSIYAPTTRPWVSLRCCRGDVCGGASGDGNTAPMKCYGAGADDTRPAGLGCFDDVAGRAPARAPGGGCASDRLVCQATTHLLGHSGARTRLAGLRYGTAHRQTLSACSTSASKSSVSSMPAA
jgi:hypothetical protein